jgi:hypothetical protein
MSPVTSHRIKNSSGLNQSQIITNRSSVPLSVSSSLGITSPPQLERVSSSSAPLHPLQNKSNQKIENPLRRSETLQVSPSVKVAPKKQNEEKCWLCRAQFRSLKSPFGMSALNCELCGNSVCEKCSSKIQLEQPKP